MAFPANRLRRLRQSEPLRSLVRETRLSPASFVYPMFVCPGEGVRKEIRSMPGVFNFSVDEAVKEARQAHALGVASVILFGLPGKKDDVATGAWADDGIVQQAARAIKREVRDLVIMGDVCLCEYMSHGHCGVVQSTGPRSLGAAATVAQRPILRNEDQAIEVLKQNDARPSSKRGRYLTAMLQAGTVREARRLHAEADTKIEAPTISFTNFLGWMIENRYIRLIKPPDADYEIVNDATLELLARTSVSLARAGVDVIAPSDMMDGRVGAIRKALDQEGLINTPILSYAAKFASGFYGPFREAADSAPQFGDRRSYQMDGANLREAMREIELDIEEGADIIMVKPAMPYLDVIAAARERFNLPLAAYQVSGEYAMIEAAARNNWIDRDRVMMESLQSIRRAGAGIILTYYAKEATKLLS
ncbi:MAG: porphobilinogen synthase [Terriglobales bacterium]